MPKQREQAIQRNKKQREQALRRQQQRKPPAQPTRTPAQPQPQPTPQPRVIVPDFTDRAKKLGELIALYLKGDWDYNQGLQTARQYAPNGTTEAELRAAVIHAAREQGNVGNLNIRALVQPEVLHPKTNIADLPKQNTLQNVVRGAQAPLRTITAGATYLAGKKNPKGTYGKESGEKPFPAPQSFAESYASDPTFGSALELAFPDIHPVVRIIAGGALDLLLDPINLLGAGAVKQTVGKTAQAIGKPVSKITEPVRRTAGAVGTRVMHPTAAKTATQLSKTMGANRTRVLDEVGKLMNPDSRFYAITRSFGNDINNINNELLEINRTLRTYNPDVAIYEPLSFEQLTDTMMRDVAATASGKSVEEAIQSIESVLDFVNTRTSDLLQSYRQYADQIADPRVKKQLNNKLDSVEAALTQFNKNKELYSEDFQTLIQKTQQWGPNTGDRTKHEKMFGRDLVDTEIPEETQLTSFLHSLFTNTARRVYLREIEPRRDVVRRGIDVWKRTKTVYNPATHTRNFVQNFLFHYLAGNISLPEMIRGIRDLPRLVFRARQAWEQGLLPEESIARLGIRGRGMREPTLREVQDVLDDIETRIPRGDVQISISDSFREEPLVHDRFGRVRKVDTTQPDAALVFAGTSLEDMPMRVADLPRNWSDLIRKITVDAFRNLRDDARRLGWRTAIAQRMTNLYNWGDRFPAMILEAGARKDVIPTEVISFALSPSTGGTPRIPQLVSEYGTTERLLRYPFRMEYSSIPELIGALNIALLPFFNYQYFALRGLRQGLMRNPERIQNILAKPVERATRITQADDERGVSQSPRFGFADREMIQLSDSRGLPFSTIYPIDPHFAEPLLSPADWLSRTPITAIARPIVQNRDDLLGMLSGVAREYTPPSALHAVYALLGEPQRGMQPTLPHTPAERWLRAIGWNVQPVNPIRIAQQQQRQAEQARRELLYDDPATIKGIVQRILRMFGIQ